MVIVYPWSAILIAKYGEGTEDQNIELRIAGH